LFYFQVLRNIYGHLDLEDTSDDEEVHHPRLTSSVGGLTNTRAWLEQDDYTFLPQTPCRITFGRELATRDTTDFVAGEEWIFAEEQEEEYSEGSRLAPLPRADEGNQGAQNVGSAAVGWRLGSGSEGTEDEIDIML
jgi:hypothetical protein